MSETTFCVTVALLCIAWYAASSSQSIVNKTILLDYAYPTTISITSLFSISFYSIPLLRIWKVPKHHLSRRYKLRFLLPISIGKAIAVTAAYMSLWKVPVSYAHTVKASMPLFAIVCSRFILHEKQSAKVYMSLLPIVGGVVLATVTEISFNFFGLMSALISTAVYALLNIITKRVYRDTNMHPLLLLSITGRIAAIVLLPFWCLSDGYKIWLDWSDKERPSDSPLNLYLAIMLWASGILSFIQNLLAFTLIHKLTAVSYSVANTTKRITVIAISLLTLRNPVTTLNVVGMLMAIVGVFLYNRSRSKARVTICDLPQHEPGLKHQAMLQRVLTSATLSDASLFTLPERLARQSGYVHKRDDNYEDDSKGVVVQAEVEAHSTQLRRGHGSRVMDI